MFKSLKLYTGAAIDLEHITASLVAFGYKKQETTAASGDFSRRGSLLDIFPYTFELPIRIDTSTTSLDFARDDPERAQRVEGPLSVDKILSIKTFEPLSGKPLWPHRMVIVLPVKRQRAFKGEPFKEEFPIDNFVDVNIGDYVVHNEHGIGKFLGLDKIKTGGNKYKDHLVIEYENQEKLYLPVEQMNLIQKYIAFRARPPKLYRLGTKEWRRTKERVRRGLQKAAWELISLQAMRLATGGFTYSADTDWQKELERSFPYRETPDQMKATLEVKSDMESGRLMDRLLCGDVGYGKTEVALRAAFKAVMDNKQVAYLVPTTILAEQHYQNFSRRLREFPVNIAMLSRFKTKSQQQEIVAGINRGTVDIVIATQRLLSGDVSFKNLGLVIIDEEQRFGVRAKEKLKKLRLNTDVLTLTATPIPRTLYMSLMGARDLSVINTPPENRLSIHTIVVKYDTDLIRQAILKELQRNGQVYFLHNRVKDIDKIKGKLTGILPDSVRIAVAHGQMPSKMLERVMLDFLKEKIDLLLCTTIVESGIDIPNVNTIIINNAHRFGLSDLHQLRGRVGRFNRSAYAYFMVPAGESLDTDAQKRLDTINEYSHLGAGFKIAMEDLELRGAGNLLGIEQHGFIAAVGFDFYCRLLREAIGNFKKIITNDKIKD